MKKRIAWLAMAGWGLLTTGYAYTGYSVCTFDNKTVAAVICYGPAVMNNTTVTGDIKVTGSLKAKGISANNMVVDGSVDLSDSQITGTVRIGGGLTANHVEFKRGVAVESDNIMLDNSVVDGLMTITSNDKTPYLQMQCGAVVTGAALFIGKAGVVQVTGDSLLKGKVINGAMEYVKRSCN